MLLLLLQRMCDALNDGKMKYLSNEWRMNCFRSFFCYITNSLNVQAKSMMIREFWELGRESLSIVCSVCTAKRKKSFESIDEGMKEWTKRAAEHAHVCVCVCERRAVTTTADYENEARKRTTENAAFQRVDMFDYLSMRSLGMWECGTCLCLNYNNIVKYAGCSWPTNILGWLDVVYPSVFRICANARLSLCVCVGDVYVSESECVCVPKTMTAGYIRYFAADLNMFWIFGRRRLR